RQALVTEMPAAIEQDLIDLHYQPLVDLHDRAIVGFEALARWTHPRLGQVPPGVFIPLAEETGLILPLGRPLLETATRQIAAWSAAGLGARTLGMSINLSPRQLMDPVWFSGLDAFLDAHAESARHLELEVTESVFMGDPERFAEILDALRRRGVRLSLD